MDDELLPVWKPKTSPRQDLIRSLLRPSKDKRRLMLVSGPRKSSKTLGCMNTIVEQLWITDNGRWSFIAPSTTSAHDSGAWQDLVNTIAQWVEGDFGMEWVTPPRPDGVSKKLYTEVSNCHGGISRIQIDPLVNEDEVEKRFKNKRYSGIYVSEMSETFKRRKSFDTVVESLRMPHLRPDEHTFIGDTNPADAGMDSWIYKLWYEFRLLDDDDLEDPSQIELRNDLQLIEIFIDQNPYLDEQEKRRIKGRYAHDPDLLARYYYGKWVKASKNSIFQGTFRPHVHIIGEDPEPNTEPEVMVPEDNQWQLFSGWDLGIVNSAAVAMEKARRMRRFKDPKTGKDVMKEETYWKCIDELVRVDEMFRMGEFAEAFHEKMQWWETLMDKQYHWTHWSDRSAFDRKEPIANRYHHEEVAEATGDAIILQGAEKAAGSVQVRIDILKKLLFEKRFYVSRHKCPQVIEMLQSIKPSRNGLQPIAKGSRYKHVFDAITYVLISEEPWDLLGSDTPKTNTHQEPISIGL